MTAVQKSWQNFGLRILLILAVLAVWKYSRAKLDALNNWALLAALALLLFTPFCRVQIGVRLLFPLVTLAVIGPDGGGGGPILVLPGGRSLGVRQDEREPALKRPLAGGVPVVRAVRDWGLGRLPRTSTAGTGHANVGQRGIDQRDIGLGLHGPTLPRNVRQPGSCPPSKPGCSRSTRSGSAPPSERDLRDVS